MNKILPINTSDQINHSRKKSARNLPEQYLGPLLLPGIRVLRNFLPCGIKSHEADREDHQTQTLYKMSKMLTWFLLSPLEMM